MGNVSCIPSDRLTGDIARDPNVEPELNTPSEQEFRANRFELVSRLADDLAHEIRNPLNAIVINLEVLKVRIARSDNDGATDRVAVIEQEARRLHQLIDRLLQLLRPVREEASSLALDQALDEILPLIEAQARLARNEFRSVCDAVAFVPIRGDVLKFALLNILTAIHERLGEGGGALSLDCHIGDLSVTLQLRAESTGVLAAPDAGYTRLFQVARDLLGPCGGTVEPVENGADIVLPRGASV
jgi:signal transduction histidine kinase